MVVGVKFEAKKMKWVSVGVVVWVSSRSDLYIGTLSTRNILPNLENLQPGTKTAITANTAKPMPFHSNPQTVFIVGRWGCSS